MVPSATNALKVPALVEFREEFTRTSVGKIQKHLLRAEARREPTA